MIICLLMLFASHSKACILYLLCYYDLIESKKECVILEMKLNFEIFLFVLVLISSILGKVIDLRWSLNCIFESCGHTIE